MVNSDQIRQDLHPVIRQIFAALPDPEGRDSATPPVVLQNQKRRAEERILDALATRGTSDVDEHVHRTVSELARRWSDRLFADAFEAVRSFEIECANEYDLNTARQDGDPATILREERNHYRRAIVKEFGHQEMRGIQAAERVMLPLSDVYVPQYLKLHRAIGDSEEQTPESIVAALSRHAVTDILGKHRNVLIIGAPGSGKTTLVAWLATELARGQSADDVGLPENTIPLVVTVRRLKETNLLPDDLSRLCGVSLEVCQSALESGEAVLLVDGLDEAPPKTARRLLSELRSIRECFPNVPVVVTSRPNALLEAEPELLPNFQETTLEPLTEDEVEDYIRKWCFAAESSLESDQRLAAEAADEAASDLIRRLEKTRSVRELARTPLLCTVLCCVHRFLGHRIPEHRITLYEKCTEVLLYEWDAAKFSGQSEPNVGELDARQKILLLAPLARRMHEAHQSEIPATEVVDIFDEILPSLNVKVSGQAVVTNIKERSGMLIEKAEGVFSFSHLTFQEYLTAVDFANRQEVNTLPERADDNWWHEVIALTAGIDGVDAESLILRLLALPNEEGPFLAALCLETSRAVSVAIRREVEDAVSSIPTQTDEDFKRLKRIGMIAAPFIHSRLADGAIDEELAVTALSFLADVDFEPVYPMLGRALNMELSQPGGEFNAQIYPLLLNLAKTPSRSAARILDDVIKNLPNRGLARLKTYAYIWGVFASIPSPVSSARKAIIEELARRQID